MTAITLMNPFGPQPAPSAGPETLPATAVQALPASDTSNASRKSGTASDQSGQGAGNGTGTGGAQIGVLRDRTKAGANAQDATPRSVVEAQSGATSAEFLERKARARAQAEATAEKRIADAELARAEAAKAEAARAARSAALPNPLPTAPILQRDP